MRAVRGHGGEGITVEMGEQLIAPVPFFLPFSSAFSSAPRFLLSMSELDQFLPEVWKADVAAEAGSAFLTPDRTDGH